MGATVLAGSEVNRGERRLVARKLKAGDVVLRSVEDPKVPAFTVARARITDHYTGGSTVEAVTVGGDVHLFWPTDVLMVAARRA